jgi:serine/threonine-protein kinase RsbT
VTELAAVVGRDSVIERVEMSIDAEDDVVLVRRRARAIAEARGFGPFAVAAVTTATSELTRNAWKHGGGGEAILEIVERTSGELGIRMTFTDHGPGIADVERVLKGGYSTGRSLGIGLSGSRRLVDEFQLETEVGRGTAITVIKWMRAT